MRKTSNLQSYWQSINAWKNHIKDVARSSRRKRRVSANSVQLRGRTPHKSSSIQWIAKKSGAFSHGLEQKHKGSYLLKIPKIFSLTESAAERESFNFLRNLFDCLNNQRCTRLTLDYAQCEEIDLAASVCMDIIIRDFTEYFERCHDCGMPPRVSKINVVNYKKRKFIHDFLYAIGAFSNVAGVNIEREGIIKYPLCVGVRSGDEDRGRLGLDADRLLAYLEKCLSKMNRQLDEREKKSLLNVIGEVLTNAEEHSTTGTRYSIGYFLESTDANEHIGVFNLVILNFGETIYEKFNSPKCAAIQVKEEMRNLSSIHNAQKYPSREEGIQEETLWTLYALQEGVTSTSEIRGSGTITFAQGFFDLKGDNAVDNISRLIILSGKARIIFDGTYRIVKRVRGTGGKTYKMLTFNENGDIAEQPDQRFVKLAPNYFPGTMIAAKICIKDK